MCDARLFQPQIDALSGNYSIHLAPITAHETINKLAMAVLDNAPPTFAMAGLSMGGIVAMEIFHLAPDRVNGLALLDTNPRAEHEAVKKSREPQIERVKNGELFEVMRDELKPRYLAETPNKPATLNLCMTMALDLGPDVFERQSRALQTRPDQCETLRKVSVPTLIVHGEHDQLCPRERHELMRELITDSAFVTIKNAGHMPTLEQPAATNAALIEWLETL